MKLTSNTDLDCCYCDDTEKGDVDWMSAGPDSKSITLLFVGLLSSMISSKVDEVG